MQLNGKIEVRSRRKQKFQIVPKKYDLDSLNVVDLGHLDVADLEIGPF